VTDDDKKTWAEAKPYVTGVVALIYTIGTGLSPVEAFDMAEGFVAEFDKRNGLQVCHNCPHLVVEHGPLGCAVCSKCKVRREIGNRGL
jgi:hypothetical protein